VIIPTKHCAETIGGVLDTTVAPLRRLGWRQSPSEPGARFSNRPSSGSAARPAARGSRIGINRRHRRVGNHRHRALGPLRDFEQQTDNGHDVPALTAARRINAPLRRSGRGRVVARHRVACESARGERTPAQPREEPTLSATTIPPLRAAWRMPPAVALAIGLAFADASVAVLALPQIVVHLHTTISHVTWVITAYNLALIATTLAILPVARMLASRRALVAGLALFGLASVASGAAGNLKVLVLCRCLQGIGGGVLLCSSLPLTGAREGEHQLRAWAVAAAVGAAVGPAAGGVLTQVFDWRAIFFAQAPFAAVAIVAALATQARDPGPAGEDKQREARAKADAGPSAGASTTVPALPGLFPGAANLALGLISAGLIGALFISSVLLINVWTVTPLGAAAILTVIPLATVVTERLATGHREAATGRIGAFVLAVGLVALALVSHRMLIPAVVALALCGVGLGLAFPALTRVALTTRGTPVARAARTVAAREGGLVLGLLLLTPILVSQLKHSTKRATPPIVHAIIVAPQLSIPQKLKLGGGLIAAAAKAPESELPNLAPAFANAAVGVSPGGRVELVALRPQIDEIVQRAATRSFRTPLLLCAALSLLAIPALSLGGRRSPLRPRED